MRASRTWFLLCLGFVAACSDTGDVAAPREAIDLGTLLVSDAAPAADGADSPSSTRTYAYVSLPEGSIPNGLSATVRNVATGDSAVAPIVDGALDPVRLAATTGDTLELTARDSSGGEYDLANEVKGRAPPVVVRSEPGRGVTDAPTLLRVRVVFSEPVKLASVTVKTVTVLLRDQPVAGSVVLSPDGLLAEFVPEDSLVAGATYTIVVNRGVQDRTGDALAQEYRIEFTVAPYTGPTIAFSSVATGREFTCALGVSGEVYCWGRGENGQLGVPGLANHHRPTRLALPSRALELSAGLRDACVLTDAQVAMCWGNPIYTYGLMDPNPPEGFLNPEPTPVFGNGVMLHVAAGGGRMCALSQEGSLACYGTQMYKGGALWVEPEPGTWLADPTLTAVSVGLNHDCYVTSGRVAYCAGENTFGQLGNGIAHVDTAAYGPVLVGGGLAFTSIAAGNDFTCGLVGAQAYCWGWNAQGELGVGTYDELYTPAPVAGELQFSMIDAGAYHTCGVTPDGAAYCWGDNRVGQLGDGTRIGRPAPVAVAGGLRFRTISASVDQTCGVTVDGVLYCWGGNREGQLGDGSTAGALVPIKAAYQR